MSESPIMKTRSTGKKAEAPRDTEPPPPKRLKLLPPSQHDAPPITPVPRLVPYPRLIQDAVRAVPDGMRPHEIVLWLEENRPQEVQSRGKKKLTAAIYRTLCSEVEKPGAEIQRWRASSTNNFFLYALADAHSETETLPGSMETPSRPEVPRFPTDAETTTPSDETIQEWSTPAPSRDNTSADQNSSPQTSRDGIRSDSMSQTQQYFVPTACMVAGTSTSASSRTLDTRTETDGFPVEPPSTIKGKTSQSAPGEPSRSAGKQAAIEPSGDEDENIWYSIVCERSKLEQAQQDRLQARRQHASETDKLKAERCALSIVSRGTKRAAALAAKLADSARREAVEVQEHTRAVEEELRAVEEKLRAVEEQLRVAHEKSRASDAILQTTAQEATDASNTADGAQQTEVFRQMDVQLAFARQEELDEEIASAYETLDQLALKEREARMS